MAAVVVARLGAPARWPVAMTIGIAWGTLVRAERELLPLLRAAGHGAACAPLTPAARRESVAAACRAGGCISPWLVHLAVRFWGWPVPAGILPVAENSDTSLVLRPWPRAVNRPHKAYSVCALDVAGFSEMRPRHGTTIGLYDGTTGARPRQRRPARG